MVRMFVLAGLVALPAAAAEPPRVAVFDFTLVNTSGAANTPEEVARTDRLTVQLQEGLRANNRYAVLDTAPVRSKLARVDSIRGCNGCQLDLARELGGQQSAYGWVQKVSNLILNVNVVIEDATTGRVIKADSVDIRGNTDESWTRGLRYLLNERFFREE